MFSKNEEIIWKVFNMHAWSLQIPAIISIKLLQPSCNGMACCSANKAYNLVIIMPKNNQMNDRTTFWWESTQLQEAQIRKLPPQKFFIVHPRKWSSWRSRSQNITAVCLCVTNCLSHYVLFIYDTCVSAHGPLSASTTQFFTSIQPAQQNASCESAHQ
jgi:hypothetical protein